MIFYQQQKYEDADANFRKALELDPHFPEADNMLRFNPVLKKAHDALPYYELGMMMYHQQKYEDAEADFKKALELDPHYGEANQMVLLTRTKEGHQATVHLPVTPQSPPSR
jgi:tetratricopeptide (TPR) repeat protein